MAKQLMLSTRISYHLSLVATVQTDLNAHFIAVPIIQLTTLFFLLWQVSRFVSLIRLELSLLLSDLTEALIFTAKVFAIISNSLAYGLGVTP
jgi:hypothetical protein